MGKLVSGSRHQAEHRIKSDGSPPPPSALRRRFFQMSSLFSPKIACVALRRSICHFVADIGFRFVSKKSRFESWNLEYRCDWYRFIRLDVDHDSPVFDSGHFYPFDLSGLFDGIGG